MGLMEQGMPSNIEGALDVPLSHTGAGVMAAPEEALSEASVSAAKTNTEGKTGHSAPVTIDPVTQAAAERLRTGRIGYRFCKRAFDIVFSLAVLVGLCWLYAIVAMAIKLDDPHGPVLFKQVRVGRDGREFQMYKFRSMVTDAETRLAQLLERNEKTGPVFKLHDDPRVTRVGRVIRKISLDELPQLFNVFRGEMSLVGPRPEIPFYVERFRETVPLYMVKYQVRPGMTGWAQIHGLRGDTSIPARVEHDLWYIENWSLGLDIMILFKTLFGGMINRENISSAASSKPDDGEDIAQ